MPRTKEQYEAMRAATRAKIHAAAVTLFTRKGFAATSVQDIAVAAGISTGLMYRHYDSKEALFYALVAEAATGLEAIGQAFRTDAPPLELLRGLTLELLHDIEKDDEFAEFMMLMNQSFMMEDAPPYRQELAQQSETLLAQTARLIEKGQAAGQFRPGNTAEMALYYFAVFQGLSIMRLTMQDRFIVPGPDIVLAFLMREEHEDADK